MRKLTGFLAAAVIAAWALVPQAEAQQYPLLPGGPPQTISCAYNSALLTVASGFSSLVQCDSNGRLLVSGGGGGAVTGASGSFVDGWNVTAGAKADAAASTTDTTPITQMSVEKQISKSVQALVTAVGTPSSAANQTAIQAPVAPATATATKSDLAGLQYNATPPAPTDGQQLSAQSDSAGNLRVTAGNTVSVCVTPTVTASNAYGTNYVVGGVLTFANAFTAKGSGILQGVTADMKVVETYGFTFIPFIGNPGTPANLADAAVANIAAADKFLPRGPISLSPNSQLGTQTVNSAAGIGEALAPGTTSLYGVLIANAALTNNFATAADVQVCIKVLQDP